MAWLLASLPRPRPSMRTRLTLLFGGLFLVSGVLLLAINYALVERGLAGQPLRLDVVQAGAVAPAHGPDEFVLELPAVVQRFPGAAPQEAPGPATGRLPEAHSALQAPGGLPVVDSQWIREARAVQAQQIMREFKRLQQQIEDRTMSELVTRSGTALVVMAVVSMGLGWLMSGRVLRPLTAITSTARRLSGTNLHERIRLRGPEDELKELADTFDEMLARLDAAFAAQRRFVANASHELRTPLTIVRTEVDVALADPDATAWQLRAAAERVRAATERSERLIESLLLLAHSERPPGPGDPVDLASAATDALDTVSRAARRRGLEVVTRLSPAVVTGDRALLERLVANLVENAVRHNVDGGWIEVTSGAAGGTATVTVANGGAVIPPEEVAGLLEPFRRRTRARGDDGQGAGLGLSIVRAVTDRHGGHLDVRARTDGGLEVSVGLRAEDPRQIAIAGAPGAPGLVTRDRGMTELQPMYEHVTRKETR